MTAQASIEARHISKMLGGQRVPDDVSLEVGPGEIHALIGLNGAGKTTLLQVLLGMLKPESGSAYLAGCPVAGPGEPDWSRVGQMLDTAFAYPELTARENIYCSARLHGMGRSSASAAAQRALSDLGLGEYSSRRAGGLSLGNRQRVGLAAALVQEPDLLVLDEPTNALDPRGVIVLRRLLREACQQRGASVLVSSHHLDEVARMAEKISVLHRRRIIGTLRAGTVDLERRFFDMVLLSDLQEQGQDREQER